MNNLPIPIIVLAFNNHEVTQCCIDSIRANTSEAYRIILVDNGSSPAFDTSPDYDLVRLDENLFYTKGINAGIRYALRNYTDFEAIALLNNDVVVNPGWLKALAKQREGNPGVIGNKHFLLESPEQIIHAGTADLIGGIHKGGSEPDAFNKVTQEVWVTFACVYITRPCLEAVGLLDERMEHFYSDNDFCLRALMAGFDVLFEPESTIYHAHSLSYKEAQIPVGPDQDVYIKKWLGQDWIDKIFNRILFDYEQKQLVVLKREIVTKAT